MLLSITAGLDFSAYADDYVVKLGNNELINDDGLYVFTPEKTGDYKFESDDFIEINEAESGISFYYHKNFGLPDFTDINVKHLTAGKRYTIDCSGTLLNITKLQSIKSIEAVNPVINGFFDYQLYPFSNLNIKVALENNKISTVNLKNLECQYNGKSVYFISNDFVFECNGLLEYGTDNSVQIKCNSVETSFNVSVDKYFTGAKLMKIPEDEYFENGEVKLYFSDGSSIDFKNDAERVNFGGFGGVGDYVVSNDYLLRSRNGIEIYVPSMNHYYDNSIFGEAPANIIDNEIYLGKNYTVSFHYQYKPVPKNNFIDLQGTEFVPYSDYVLYTSVYNNFINGTNPPYYTEFSPKTAITRAMFVTILYRMAGEPYKNANPYNSSPFTDITNTGVYYYDAACWALDNKITTQTTFKPYDNVSREQTASFLFRYAKENDMLGDDAYKNVNLSVYHDYDNIRDWAEEAMQWSNYNGMITGTQQGYANPQGSTLRIHATKILYGFGKVCNIGNFE